MSQPQKRINVWQANFYTGLAIILPVVISLAIVKWLFGTVANITDMLLFFLKWEWLAIDPQWIYAKDGQMYIHWSLLALCLAVALITLVGRLARHFLGKKLIQLMDYIMFNVPLLNKIYGTIKQVNTAFTSSKKSSFKQVVLVEFPKDGMFSVGFITNEQHEEIQVKIPHKVISVFVPTTPNPTTGFLLLLSEDKVTKLDMSVADGIKFIVSLGSVAPNYVGGTFPETGSAATLPDTGTLQSTPAATVSVSKAVQWKNAPQD